MSEHVADTEPYILAEEVAERLGLPLSVLLRRVEAGDVPSQRVERDDGMHYALRLSDLGIETGDADDEDPGSETDDPEDEPDGISVFDEAGSHGVEQAIASAFNPGVQPAGEEAIDIDASAWQQTAAIADEAVPAPDGATWSVHEAAPAWSTRPLEPQEPPVWIRTEARAASVEEVPAPPPEAPQDVAPSGQSEETEVVGTGHVAAEPADAPTSTPEFRERRRAPEHGLIDGAPGGPRTDVAAMSLDARDLVAGLLDRWERTLEQRIYTEQRQRFQAELTARQTMVKQLQMELQTARAEHAAAQAEKDRVLAAKERELAERERDLADTRRQAEEAGRAAAAAPRRRRWFGTRGND
ncbi:MAG TPA: hypothetical protein VH498_08045 [Candidatus Dormibacteraeota bacterium]|nr:hypothetical protein [Candidatus Dormibacteraeota bacterium]